MKKLSTIIMALALLLGMSQCKKQETPTTGNTTPSNPGVHITVNVGDQDGKGENGEKYNIAPAYGLFAFTNDDVLYVGHNGKYVGSLTFSNGFFSGTIYPDETVTDQPLHFYFIGNAAVTETPTVNQTTPLSISIADQRQNLPVLSYGASTKPFTGTGTTYSTTLRNQCALVRFDLATQGNYTVTLSGVPTQATVDFASNAITPDLSTTSDITLYGESGNTMYRWAILLPGTDLRNRTDLPWSGEDELPVMANNTYINSGLGINNTIPLPPAPAYEYAVRTSDSQSGLVKFSVGTNKKVYFSRANLRAQYNDNSFPVAWSFPDDHYPYNQYLDVSGGITTQVGGYNYTYHAGGNYIDFSSSTSYGDRFTWGYSNQYQQTGSDFCQENHDLSTDNVSYADWGYVLKDTDYGDHWRTLSQEEWNYLLFERPGNRFLKVQLQFYDPGLGNVCTGNKGYGESIYGIFVFPDGYDGEGLQGTYTFNDASADFITGRYLQIHSTYYAENDAKKMLEAGAVFLPAAGYRDGTLYMQYDYYSCSWHTASVTAGYYWTSSHVFHPDYAANYQACAVSFDKNGIHTTVDDKMYRQYGCCVRLVWDADPN
jgi:hypothetical protein